VNRPVLHLHPVRPALQAAHPIRVHRTHQAAHPIRPALQVIRVHRILVQVIRVLTIRIVVNQIRVHRTHLQAIAFTSGYWCLEHATKAVSAPRHHRAVAAMKVRRW